MAKVAKVHITFRVPAEAKAHVKFEADQESSRTGEKWTVTRVVMAWWTMGRAAWLDGRRPE